MIVAIASYKEILTYRFKMPSTVLCVVLRLENTRTLQLRCNVVPCSTKLILQM